MFDHPQIIGADQYLVEVAWDDGSNLFKRVLAKQKDSSTATMLSNFEFGKKYMWRYAGLQSGKELGWNGPYSFEILSSLFVDKNLFRVRVLQNDSLSNSGGLIVLDKSGTIIDRKGNAVWFLPPDNGYGEKQTIVTPPVNPAMGAKDLLDLTFTPFGSLTFIRGFGIGTSAEERDLRGNILWRAPSRNDRSFDSLNTHSSCEYHHCFKRLSSGNYMVLDRDVVLLDITQDSSSAEITATNFAKVKIGYEIIKEFDRDGNLLWSWSSKKYFNLTELRSLVIRKAAQSLRNPTNGGHMNSFDIDELNGFVYAGFRNANRVIKIDKKSGCVVGSWGNDISSLGGNNNDDLFSKQHGTTLLRDGSIAIFNNNPEQIITSNKKPASSVLIFNQFADDPTSRKIWKFDCSLDTGNNMSLTGGNVDELKSNNLLVGMGDVNRVFEITRGKRIVWSALIESYDQKDSTWRKFSTYRAHYTSSLYPCYFTIQTNCDTLSKTEPSFQVKIFNDGTENDSYQVDIKSLSGMYQEQFSTVVLPCKKSISFNIEPGNLSIVNDKIVILVKSKTNPDFIRTVYIPYTR